MKPQELNRIAALLKSKLENLHRQEADIVPPGWFTSDQLAAAMKKDQSTTCKLAKKLKLEKRKFRVFHRNKLTALLHYRLSDRI